MKTPGRKPYLIYTTMLLMPALMRSADAVSPEEPLLAASVSPAPVSISIGTAINPAPALESVPDADSGAETDATENGVLPSRPAYDGVGTNLFAGHSWYTPPPPRTVVRERTVAEPRKPTPPALPFTFIGRFEQEGQGTLYYLVDGDKIHDVRVGDTINGIYRVDGVTNGNLMFTYLPLKSSQGLRLGE